MKTYPYTAWRLMPSFKPVEVVLTKEYASFGKSVWDISDQGKVIEHCDIFATRDAAITEGLARLATQQIKLDKKQVNIDKRKVALTKKPKATP